MVRVHVSRVSLVSDGASCDEGGVSQNDSKTTVFAKNMFPQWSLEMIEEDEEENEETISLENNVPHDGDNGHQDPAQQIELIQQTVTDNVHNDSSNPSMAIIDNARHAHPVNNESDDLSNTSTSNVESTELVDNLINNESDQDEILPLSVIQ